MDAFAAPLVESGGSMSVASFFQVKVCCHNSPRWCNNVRNIPKTGSTIISHNQTSNGSKNTMKIAFSLSCLCVVIETYRWTRRDWDRHWGRDWDRRDRRRERRGRGRLASEGHGTTGRRGRCRECIACVILQNGPQIPIDYLILLHAQVLAQEIRDFLFWYDLWMVSWILSFSIIYTVDVQMWLSHDEVASK